MITIDPGQAARDAVAANPTRAATALIFDSIDARLIVFRLAPGQAVAPHRSPSTVMLTVLQGEGILAGGDGERRCRTGDVVIYAPGELHGMRAESEELQLLATITPRPGERKSSDAVMHGAGEGI